MVMEGKKCRVPRKKTKQMRGVENEQKRLPILGKCKKTALWDGEAMKFKVDKKKKKKERSEVVK